MADDHPRAPKGGVDHAKVDQSPAAIEMRLRCLRLAAEQVSGGGEDMVAAARLFHAFVAGTPDA